MSKFIKSALVLLLLASAAVFAPQAQAKSGVPSVQPNQCKDVVFLAVAQQGAGSLTGVWTTVPPGNQSTVSLWDMTANVFVDQVVIPGTTHTFNNLIVGHLYLYNVAHGTNPMSKQVLVKF